jgi:hypothetical protein
MAQLLNSVQLKQCTVKTMHIVEKLCLLRRQPPYGGRGKSLWTSERALGVMEERVSTIVMLHGTSC